MSGTSVSMRGRWAVTGLACRYPDAPSAEALWRRLQDGAVLPAGEAARRLAPSASRYADFSIPPIYRTSINRLQLDLLELAADALAQAGMQQGDIDLERTDVIFCTGFGMNRCFENHARVLGVELAAAYARALPAEAQAGFVEAARVRLDRAFAGTSHDKVGEMASSMASRIAGCFKLRGRALAMEAQDLGGVEALLAGLEALDSGQASAVLIVAGQRIESALMRAVLATRLGGAHADALCEGACAMVLQGPAAVPSRVRGWVSGLRLTGAQPATAWADFVAESRGGCGDEPCYWAVGALLEADEVRAAVPAGDTVRSARGACGWGYALEGLTALAHGVLAQQGAGAAQVRVLGRGMRGAAYALSLGPADAAARAPAAQPVAVLSFGARFGPTAGAQAYWDALCSSEPQFRPLEGRRFRPDIYRTPDGSAALSYGIAAASYADLPTAGADESALVAPAARLADAAAQEALEQLRGAPQWADASVLVVTASNLTLGPERRLAAQEYLPQIERELEALAAEQELPEPVRAQGMRVLRDAAYLPPLAEEPAGTDLVDTLAASGISRRIAARFGASSARCVAVEAACAGSLAAIEMAVNSLRAGHCKVALVAGVELPVNVHDLCLCSAQRMLAPGLIATFTEQATGFTPGDGAGVLVLAREDDARSWGEPVLAVLRAVASCTESKSIIAPNPSGQMKAMRRAFEQVDFAPAEVDYIETHGTGTLTGDEVEVESLGGVYGGTGRAVPLRLGALKAQFGHCFAAAGMASFIKTVLALRHARMPANHYAHPLKADLRLEQRGFDPLVQAAEWPAPSGRPRRAAINAFGTGGVNVHLLLEDSPE